MDIERTTPSCYRHPDRETRLSCSNCGRPICVECSHDAAVGQRCPECAGPDNRTRVIRARDLQRGGFAQSPVTYSIMAVSVGLFILGFASQTIDSTLIENLALGRFQEVQGRVFVGPLEEVQWWRVLTSALLHANITHVLFNMYALYLFGPRLEREAGPAAFAVAYAAAAAAGGSTYLVLRSGEISFAVGASGAIFGLFGIWLAATWRLRHTPAGRAMFNQLIVLLGINAALPLIVRNIAWEAHAGGLVVGFVIGMAWAKFAAGRPDAVSRRIAIAATLGLLALAVAVFI